jgi:hypothetical protein
LRPVNPLQDVALMKNLHTLGRRLAHRDRVLVRGIKRQRSIAVLERSFHRIAI